MTEEIYATASVFTDVADEERAAALLKLCSAMAAALRARLKPGLTPEDCKDSFICAAAWLALAALDGADGAVERFTAGEIAVTRSSGAADCLRAQAMVLMAPYLAEEFAFLEV